MKPDLIQLWKRFCSDDDTKAFESLYYALFNKLIKFCIHYISNRQAAEEIVSEIFVKCWNNRKKLADIEFPETYLFVAVKNQSIKYNKKYSSIQLVEIEGSNEVLLVDTADPQEIIERKEMHHRLDQAIETLPMQAKMVFRLIKENGLRYKEVAEILEISPRTVQTQLFRAIDKLRLVLHSYKKSLMKDNPGNKILSIALAVYLINYFF